MSKNFQLVRYKGKINLEVACNPETVLLYRQGKLGLSKVQFSDEIWKSFSKGEAAQVSDLMNEFETEDKNEVFKIILEKGDYQMSTKERREFLEKKRLEIVNYIHKNYVNPQTKLPHPIVRIEQALKEIKYQIVPNKTASKQVEEMFSQLCTLIRLKKDQITGALTLKHEYVGKCQSFLSDRNLVSILNTEYLNEGTRYELEICPGDYDKLFKRLHDVTKGDFAFKIDGAEVDEKEKEKEVKGAKNARKKNQKKKKGKGGKGGKGKKGKKKY